MQTMYPAFVNSPETVTLGAISPTATTVTVQDITKIPEPPNLLVIGGDRPDAETVLLTAVSGSTLTIQRAVNGSARTWADRTTIARNFTAYDHDAFKANIEALNTEKLATDGNGSNVTAAFSQAATKANISTGEKLSVIFGKLMKWYASFGAAAWMGTGTTSSTVALGNHTHTAAAVGAATPADVAAVQAIANNAQSTADAAMAQKARLYISFEALGLTEATATIENIIAAMENGSILVVGCATEGKTNGLVPENYGLLRVTKRSASYVMWEYQIISSNAQLWRGYYNGGVTTIPKWSGWHKIATSDPPTWYNLTPAGSYTVGTAYLKYCKDSGGTVFLTGAVQKSSAPTSGETMMILPEGFRPATYISFTVAQLAGSTGAPWCAVCCVETSGVVRFYSGTLPPNFATTKDLVINVVFPAVTV